MKKLIPLLFVSCTTNVDIPSVDGKVVHIQLRNGDILSTKTVTEWVDPKKTVEERSVGCTHPGYCYGCGMGFHGKMSCGLRFSAVCSGSKSQTVEITWYRYHTEYTTKTGSIYSTPYMGSTVKVLRDGTCG